MSTIDYLNAVSLLFSIYVGTFIFVSGIIGNIFNILVFLSLKTFRQNSCAFYLTAMSFLNIGQLVTSLLPRTLNFWFTIDWSIKSLAYCKIRVYLFQVCTLASFSCMCLATIDQFLITCSHPRWQRFSSIKFAHYFFKISILVWILHGIPVLIYQNDILLPSSSEYTCAISNQVFQSYNTYGFTLVYVSILPVLVTVIFGSLAYRNVTQLAYRAVPLIRRELDRQLTVMVLVEVGFNFCIVVPYSITYMVNLGINISKDSYSYAQLQLARNITITWFYLYFAIPFYIYICVSERFRKQFIYALFGIYIRHRRRRRMTINPLAIIN